MTHTRLRETGSLQILGSLRPYRLRILAVTLILVIFLSGYFAGVALGTSSVTITPLSFHGDARFTVFKIGSTYYAKNGSSGAITYSSTNASYVVNSALAFGGTIILSGVSGETWTFTAGIRITKHGTSLRSMSSEMSGLVLHYDGSGPFIKTVADIGNYITGTRIEGISISADLSNTGVTYALQLEDVQSCSVRDLTVNSFNGTGVYINSNLNPNTCAVDIYNTRMYDVRRGIEFGANVFQINVWGGQLNGLGLAVSGTFGFKQDAGTTYDINCYGITISAFWSGIWIDTAAWNPSKSTWTNLQLETLTRGVYVVNAAYDISINGKITFTSVTQMYNLDPNCQIRVYRQAGVQWGELWVNHGVDTVANNEWIAHSLVGTPKIVLVTPEASLYASTTFTVVADVRNSTHFQVSCYWTNGTAISADAIVIDWYAEYYCFN